MSRRTLAIATALSIVTAFGVAASARQARITNAQLATNPGGRALASTVQSLTASTADVAWIGYMVPVKDRDRTMCCWSNGNGYFSGSMASRGWSLAVRVRTSTTIGTELPRAMMSTSPPATTATTPVAPGAMPAAPVKAAAQIPFKGLAEYRESWRRKIGA